MQANISDVFLRKLYRQKGYGLMLFTVVIFSTYKFTYGSLANAKSAPSFFMFKNNVVLNIITLVIYGCSKFKKFFLLKDLIFTSPQLKITLFKPVLLQLALTYLYYLFLASKNNQLIKRESNVSVY